MGRIAPRRSKTRWNAHLLWQSCQRLWCQRRGLLNIVDKIPSRKSATSAKARRTPYGRISLLLRQLWHLPDGFQWMEPLPYPHRRWLLISAALLLIVLLWPYSSTPEYPVSAGPTNVPLTSESAPVQARRVAPAAAHTASAPVQQQPTPAPIEKSWQNYQIASGQTLAQLFRDHNLPVNDVFAMAQVEGSDKPLSNLHAGQKVRLRLNAQDVVSELEIDTTDNQTVQFVRQQDGAFVRTR